MDIENDQEENSQKKDRSNSMNTFNRVSLKSRKSNESAFSWNMSLEYPNHQNQKISLQSDISGKARQKFGNDLFQNLANQDDNFTGFSMRDQGSYKYYHQVIKNRNTQGQKTLNHEMMHSQIKPLNFHEQMEQHEHNNEIGVNKQQNFAQKFIQPTIPQKTTCKCPRSKCLLMYCECFSKGILCNSDCSCYQCRNNTDFQQKRQNARKIVLERDPNAFSNKLQIVGGQQTELAYKRGCNCKKTNCFKKYCQCYYAGVKCTYLCKCQNCMNGGQNAFKG